MKIVFTKTAKKDFIFFKEHNSREYVKIKELLVDIIENNKPAKGRPEKLKGDLAGFWSRRINHKDRLVYKKNSSEIHVISCRYHY
jgi:toxin YoeB